MAQTKSASCSGVLVLLGAFAFVFGVGAEFAKPPSGTIIDEKGGALICRCSDDYSYTLSEMSIGALFLVAAIGMLPAHAPSDVISRSAKLMALFTVSVWMSIFAAVMMAWAALAEANYFTPENECATIKTGLFGGAAFLVLVAAILWVILHELVMKDRFDFIEDSFQGCALLA